MSPESTLFLLVTGGAFITSLTGLGGGSLVLAGLMVIFPPALAIPLHAFNQLTANGIRTFIFWKEVNWRIVFSYGLLMLPASWAAGLLFEYVNPNWLKVLVGVTILVSFVPFKSNRSQPPGFRTFAVLGAVSGFLSVFVGAVGPMVTPFFNRLPLKREGLLSTKSGGQLLLQLAKISAFSGAAGLDLTEIEDKITVLVAGSLLGVLLSIPVSKRVSDQRFDFVVNVLLAVIAVKVIFDGLVGLF